MAGLLVEAAVRVPLVYLLPISVTVGVSEALMVVTFGVLIAWNVRYVAQLKRRAQEEHGLGCAGEHDGVSGLSCGHTAAHHSR